MEASASTANEADVCMCVVCVLLRNGFLDHSFSKQLEIAEKGRPQPLLENLSTKTKTCTRHFKVEIYQNYEWLTGCETLCRLFCWPCLLFAADKGLWNKSGFCDLNNLHKVVKRHAVAKAHLQAVFKEKVFGKLMIERTIDNQLRIGHRQYNELVTKNRGILKSIIDVVCYLGEYEHALREGYFADQISLMAKYDGLLKNHLEQCTILRGNSDHIQHDLIAAVAAVVLEKMQSEIKEARFVAIILNETTDSANINQLSTVLRYIKADGNIQERFFGFINVIGSRTFDSLYTIVCNIIKNFELSNKFIAYSYDGAHVTAGSLGDLQVKIRETFPNALFVHSFAHRPNFVLSESVTHIKGCKSFFSILHGMVAFFSKSAVHARALNLILQKKSPEIAPIRWNHNERLVLTVCEHRESLIELFEDILQHSCDWNIDTLSKSKGYLECLKRDFNFNFLLNVFSEIFSFADGLFDTIQNKLSHNAFCVRKMEKLKTGICNKKNDFDKIWEKTMEAGLEPKTKRLRISSDEDMNTSCRILLSEIVDQIYKELKYRFNLYQLKFLELCNFREFEDKPFDVALKPLIDHYGSFFDATVLHSELAVIYAADEVMIKTSTKELLNFLKQSGLNKTYLEVTKMCELLLTIPIISSTPEGSSTVLKRIETFVKNSTTESRLSKLPLLYIEKDLLKEMTERPRFYDDVIDDFSKQNRRMELHYK